MDVTEIGRRSPGPVIIEVLSTGVIVAVVVVPSSIQQLKRFLLLMVQGV